MGRRSQGGAIGMVIAGVVEGNRLSGVTNLPMLYFLKAAVYEAF